MTRLILNIYDYLARHRATTIAAIVLLMVVCALLSLRLGYQENAAEFLPHNPENERYMTVYDELAGQGRITVIFRSQTDDPDDKLFDVTEAVEAFDQSWQTASESLPQPVEAQCYVEQSQVFDAMDYVRQHIGLFLTPADFARADSLLAQPQYIETSLANVHRMLSYPMGQMAQDAIVADPLNLFSPALSRLQGLSASDQYEVNDDILFDLEGNGYAFIDSPWGGSDTRNNALLADVLQQAIDSAMAQVPQVQITAVGAPLIAVTNARQIKHDSILAMLLSVSLIAAILLFAIRRKRNILLLGLSVLAGWLFALALLSLFRPSISIIVIGIGSVLVGIAVNYPLHFLDHLGEYPDRRATLLEMVEPLVTGNITTVSAFACLVFMKADAMRDLGLFGALMLVGTILFVMICLPQLAKAGSRKQASAPVVDEAPKDHPILRRIAGWAFLPVVAVTLVLGILSTRTQFDSDLHHINYMTSQQQADLALLSQSMQDSGMVVEYLVSEAPTLDQALKANAALLNTHPQLAQYRHSGVGDILPSLDRQQTSIQAWMQFVANHPGLVQKVSQQSQRQGFSATAFEPFYNQLQSEYTPLPAAVMDPLVGLSANYIHTTDSHSRVVTFLTVPQDQSQEVKAQLRATLDTTSASFVFDINDVGTNLVQSLNTDFNYLLYVCSFIVFFFLWLSFGRLELALLSFLPMAVGWLWILGIMDLCAIKFNIVNVILATFIFGQGDDYTIFITEGLLYENAYGRRRLRDYRRSVIISALLMFVGIGTLIFAKHPAMRSLAEVAIIGMACVVLMACYLPPLVYRWLTTHKGQPRLVPVTLGRLVKTVWILLVFFVAAFVLVTPYTFFYRLIGRDSDRKRLRFHRIIHRFTRFAVTHLPGVTFHFRNPQGETFEKPAVIIANHQSHLDLICMLQMHPKMVILTNDWVWRNPIYGLIIRYAEFYPVSDGYDNILPHLQSLVNRGYSILVFPEGTRSVTGEIGRFHKGAFQLAQQLGVDIVPAFIHGASDVMPKNDILLRPGQLTVELQPRIPYATFAAADLRQFTHDTRHYYLQHFDQLRLTLEDENYWLPLVRYRYLYKGRDIDRRARKALKQYQADHQFQLGQGEIALLLALSHRDQQFTYSFTNPDDYLVASHIVGLPPNLKYQLDI